MRTQKRIERKPAKAEGCRAGPGIGIRSKIFVGGLLFGACQGTIEGCTCIAWSSTIVTDLETKAEKYKTKAAQCEEWALQAPVGAQRDLYEVLARYYGELATNFRQVIEKRKAA